MSRLETLKVVFVDTQTTGAGPTSGRLLEWAWRVGAEETSHVLQGELGEMIPPRILRMTGITPEDVANGDASTEIVQDFARDIASTTHAVAHFARFEAAFVGDLWQKHRTTPFPLAWLCTHKIGRKLWPNAPSASLRAMVGALGYPMEQIKRAGPHVEATRFLWQKIVQELAVREKVTTLEELATWLGIKTTAPTGPKQFLIDRAFRLALPDAPGIYKMLGPENRILYIGKATSLKSRVNSYFTQRRGHNAAKRELLAQVRDIQIVACASALEAALLETDEIKRHDPPYNVALRTNKRRVAFLARGLETEGTTYGPYASAEPLFGLRVLTTCIANDAPELLSTILFEDVAHETLRDGLALFVAGSNNTAVRSLLASGVRFARRQIDLDDDPEDVVEASANPADDAVRVLTADDILARLWDVVHAAGREHLRARALSRMTSAAVAWRDKGAKRWRFLKIADGRIAEDGFTTRPLTLTIPATTESFVWDIAAYDRLRVLTTELARATKLGTRVIVRTSASYKL